MRENHNRQIRIWAMLCHLSGLLWIPLACLVFISIPLYLPFLNILGPLMIWRFRKATNPWIDFQGKESLNFQLSMTVYALIVIVISLFLVFTTCGIVIATNGKGNQVDIIFDTLLIVLVSLILLIMLLQTVLVTFASIKAYKGEYFRYPVTIRFLK